MSDRLSSPTSRGARRWHAALAVLLLALVALACARPPAPPAPSSLRTQTVASGLDAPTAMALAPDGRVFVAERRGKLRVVTREGALLQTPAALLPVVALGGAGLLGVAVDPRFASNHYLYVLYTYEDPASPGRYRNRVDRLTESNNLARQPFTVLQDLPGGTSGNGGRLAFGPDGKLYVSVGDASDPALAADPSSMAGKVLRVNPDGSAPRDNPKRDSLVYSSGHRVVEGMAWPPRSGHLYAVERASDAYDELNVVEGGKRYGWPSAAGPGEGGGAVGPVGWWSPPVGVTALAFYDGALVPGWRGSLLLATRETGRLWRITFDDRDRSKPRGQEALVEGQLGQLRDVAVGPDGAVYLLTGNTDSGEAAPAGDDRVVRLAPAG